MPTVRLIDGREVDSASEEWRHECEVRHIANLPDRARRNDYMDGIRKKRGPAAAQALESLAIEIFHAQRSTRREALARA